MGGGKAAGKGFRGVMDCGWKRWQGVVGRGKG